MTMSEWSVAVTIPGPGRTASLDAAIAGVAGELSAVAPVVSASANAVTVRVLATGTDVAEAVEQATGAIRRAVESVGWTFEVRDLEATEWSFFESKLEEPSYPDLVGITEIAQLLGTSRQRASELARSSKFPAPLAELAAGPVWAKPTVARFVEEWDRKPGRPRTKTGQRLEEIVAERKPTEEEART